MVAWFIIAIATLAVFAFIAISGVQTVAMTTDAAGRIETVRRLDASVNALLARAAPANGDGVVYLPVGAANPAGQGYGLPSDRSEEHTSELQSLMRIPYAVFFLKIKKRHKLNTTPNNH